MPQKDQLVLGYDPKGHDLNRSARSDLILSDTDSAYRQTVTLREAGKRVKVVLHFVGTLTEIQSCHIWMVTRLRRSDSDRRQGAYHYQLNQRPHWTANADTIALNEKGQPTFFKRCQQREKVGRRSVRPAVSALSK